MTLKKFDAPTRKPVSSLGTRRKQILYVEDEDVNWEMASRRLRDSYDLVRARNARETFQMMTGPAFAAILMDIQLQDSDMDGIAITQALKQVNGVKLPSYADPSILTKVPAIIFVSAYTARYDKKLLKTYGGDDLIPKPVDFTTLSLTLSRIILRNV